MDRFKTLRSTNQGHVYVAVFLRIKLTSESGENIFGFREGNKTFEWLNNCTVIDFTITLIRFSWEVSLSVPSSRADVSLMTSRRRAGKGRKEMSSVT